LSTKAGLLCLLLSGCALAPDRVNIEAQHVSHLSQHFGPDPTNLGYEFLGVDVHWQAGRLGVDVAEGAVLGTCVDSATGIYNCNGALAGPRETFNARVDYAIWTRAGGAP
jgi:hypothetical protein